MIIKEILKLLSIILEKHSFSIFYDLRKKTEDVVIFSDSGIIEITDGSSKITIDYISKTYCTCCMFNSSTLDYYAIKTNNSSKLIIIEDDTYEKELSEEEQFVELMINPNFKYYEQLNKLSKLKNFSLWITINSKCEDIIKYLKMLGDN